MDVIAIRHILHNSRQYAPGDRITDFTPEMLKVWLKYKSVRVEDAAANAKAAKTPGAGARKSPDKPAAKSDNPVQVAQTSAQVANENLLNQTEEPVGTEGLTEPTDDSEISDDTDSGDDFEKSDDDPPVIPIAQATQASDIGAPGIPSDGNGETVKVGRPPQTIKPAKGG